MASGSRALVEALVARAPHVSPADTEAKRRLLERLEATVIGAPRVLGRYHEALCYLQAYPDDPELLARVDRALAGWGRRMTRLSRRARARLADSGMAGTALTYPFGFPMARWLAARVPRQVRIAWRNGEEGERLEEVLSLLVTGVEVEAFTEGGPGWRRWLEIAAAGSGLTTLQLLLTIFENASLDEATRDWLFESLGLTLEWRLSPGGPSRTHARLPVPSVFYHGLAAPGRPPAGQGGHGTRRAFLGALRQPLRLQPASPGLAVSVIEAARLAMATRARELEAFSHPNPDDVLLAEADRGLRIALIGLPPARRLPLDAYYAFLVFKNGVPVSYGAAWYLFGTLEFAFNVFESFRHGEAAFIAGQALRIYRQVFGVRAIAVDRYQIGYQNDEALRSGAFYFYQRLGFHPVERQARRLARAERERIARDPTYRSPLAVLRRLARSDLVTSVAPGAPPPRVRAGVLATLVSRHVARQFAGDRAAAVRAAATHLRRTLGLRAPSAWRTGEGGAFETFSLLLGLVPDLATWSGEDRRRLAAIIRAKEGRDERGYARLLDGHRRLHGALIRLSTGADR